MEFRSKKISTAAGTATLIASTIISLFRGVLDSFYDLCELEEDERMSLGELLFGVTVTLAGFLAFLALTSFIILQVIEINCNPSERAVDNSKEIINMTNNETIFPVTREVFDALGVYVQCHQFQLLGTTNVNVLEQTISQLARMNYAANLTMNHADPTCWLPLEAYRYSPTRSIMIDLAHMIPHFNRERALEAVQLINESCGPLKTASDQALLSSLEARLTKSKDRIALSAQEA
ncbi:hypothetical protein [Lacticaseibacillus jixiensis]|jgi:hypothetical protein|uniref:hypothetical protein n=1 Tax=Lacticaseibacillus TaxID=2759736 RepID=UPI0036F3D864